MRIGLLGFGTVGKGVYELTAARDDMRVVRVLCRREMTLPDAEVTHDFSDILRDDSIDTVVEAIGGLHPAFDYVKAALEAGKHVVTANKAMVANFYDILLPLAQSKGVSFRCTASVGGGIGWLSELERVRRCEKVTCVGGIMNGTCNVDGIDTWHKLIVSSNIAFGISVDIDRIPAAGIRSITAADVENFKNHSLTCKLISTGSYENGIFSGYVQPTLCPAGEPEAAVPANYNLITLVGDISGRQSFFGQGAGRYPTAYNVLQDLIDLLAGRGFYCPYGPKVSVDNSLCLRYYVRGGDLSVFAGKTAETWGDAIITAPVSVDFIHRWLRENSGAFIAAMPRH